MSHKYPKIVAAVMMTLGLVGCGEAFRSQGANSSTSMSTPNSVESQLTKAEAASESALVAIDHANQALREITDAQGNINLAILLKNNVAPTGSEKLMEPVIAKLRMVFDNLFAQVASVENKFGEARQLLLAAMAQLDTNVPEHAVLIAQAMAQLKKLDLMERQFSRAMHTLAGKLDLAVVALEKVISGATSFIPGWGFIADLALDWFVMGDIKNFIAEIKMRLLAI